MVEFSFYSIILWLILKNYIVCCCLMFFKKKYSYILTIRIYIPFKKKKGELRGKYYYGK